MGLHPCPQCQKYISANATFCSHCGWGVAPSNVIEFAASGGYPATEEHATSPKDFGGIVSKLVSLGQMKIKRRYFTRLSWFLFANAAIVLSISIISGGSLVSYMPFLIVFSCVFPFLALLFSRWLAKRSHGIVLIDDTTDDDKARALYAIVKQLAARAGLKKVPQVGIYASDDMNAFATGPTRNRSMVAFSTGLIDGMDDSSIAAVTAHEISHIANGDMVTLALVQSVVNIIINVITFPLKVFNIIAVFDANVGAAFAWMVTIFRWILTLLLVFLGSLVVKAFSRHREFKADALAARLLDKESMIGALERLGHDTARPTKAQHAYSAFKINGPRYWLDIFSTHPSLKRRIARLQKLNI